MDFNNLLLLSLTVVILIKYNVQVSFFLKRKEKPTDIREVIFFKVLDKMFDYCRLFISFTDVDSFFSSFHCSIVPGVGTSYMDVVPLMNEIELRTI